ncbi:hypothetical protein CPC08DRAFT_717436 [Agrocybe pediades]|nr:hypothetical protein CPC08DRAFT_717436 [Agrocybe pediades]
MIHLSLTNHHEHSYSLALSAKARLLLDLPDEFIDLSSVVMTSFDESTCAGDPRTTGKPETQIQVLQTICAIESTTNTEQVSMHVNCMPPEILSYILQLSLPRRLFTSLPSARPNDISIPFKFGSVCSRWREIAWSTPQLWSYISVKHSHNPETVRHIEDWISRSKAVPITIAIHEERRDDSVRADDWRKCLVLLARCSERWADIFLHLSMPSMQYLCSAIRPSSLGRSMPEPFRRDKRTRHKAGDNMCWHTLTQVDPSTQRHTPITFGLVSIALSKISVSDGLNIIKLSPRLVSCTLDSLMTILSLQIIRERTKPKSISSTKTFGTSAFTSPSPSARCSSQKLLCHAWSNSTTWLSISQRVQGITLFR